MRQNEDTSDREKLMCPDCDVEMNVFFPSTTVSGRLFLAVCPECLRDTYAKKAGDLWEKIVPTVE